MNLIFFKLLPTIIGITLIIGAAFMLKPREKEILKPREVFTITLPEETARTLLSTKGANGIQGNRRGEVIIITSLPLSGEP